MKKTLSIALSLIMIITTLCALPFTAKAESYSINYVTVNNKQLTAEYPCFVNGEVDPWAYTNSYNAYYDEANSTLFLKDFIGGTVNFSKAGGDVTVKLIGNNIIKGYQFGIKADGSALTVTSESGGTLNITTETYSTAGIANYWSNDNSMPITISGSAQINIDLESDSAYANIWGIKSQGKVSILDDASLNIKAISTSGVMNVYGISYPEVLINTTGNVYVEAGKKENSAVAIAAPSLEVLNVNTLTIKANSPSRDGICNSTNYDRLLALKGYEITETKEGYDFFLQLKKHTLSLTEAKAATCTEAGSNAYYTCSTCGKFFKDEAGTQETAPDEEKVEALGHDMTVHDGAQATCTTNGNLPYCECTRCGNYYIDDLGENIISDKTEVVIPATDHDFGENEKVCKVCGIANPNYKEPDAPIAAKKKKNTLKASGKTVKVKKNKKTVIKKAKAFTVKNAKGTVTFKKSKGNKKITVAKNGKITVKKGLKKGTYKVKVKVTAAGNKEYKAAVKTVTVTIKVK